MTAQQLRNSILQQAIQGRLVPQDPSEGNADVLLSAIRQTKELLYKSKKISKRDFEVSEIQEDEILFDIPESWTWIRIGDIFKHSTGKSLNEANRKGNPHEYITTSNVFWNRFELKKLRQMYYTDEELDKCQAEPGDLLVLEGGDVGRAAVWNKDYKICLQNHIHKLHPYEPLDVYFYYYCFFLYHDMGLIGGKGIGIQGLSSGALHNIAFPLPPLAEQKRIVAKIEELMPLVEKYGKAQSELDNLNASLPSRLRQSILQEAIQGKLVEQDPNEEDAEEFYLQLLAKKKELLKLKQISKRDFTVGEITDENTPSFDIPNKWRWIRVGDLFKHSTGKALNEANKRGQLRDYITTSNVYWNNFKLEKLRQMYFSDDELDKCQATKGDLLVLEGGDIGRAAIWNYDHNICLQNHIHKLRGYMEVENKFYYYCFQLYHDCGLIGGKGIGIQGLSYTNLHELVFPLPPLAEQRRIVAKIEELFAEIDKLK